MTHTETLVVVLGAKVREGGEPSPTLMRRIEWGVELIARGDGQWLLATGAAARAEGPSEARVVARFAAERGVPADRVLLEETARNTWENARECARILRNRRWRRVILVTDDFHRPRALLAFRAFGIPATACPICRGHFGTPLGVSIVRHLLELVAIPYYGFRLLYLRLTGSGGGPPPGTR